MVDETIAVEELQRLSPDGLRELFLFEALTDEQLVQLSEQGYLKECGAGQVVYAEGADATCFFVLLSGTVTMTRKVEDTEVETSRTNQRGVYGGATVAFLRTDESTAYMNSMTAITACQFWVIDAPLLGSKVGRGSRWPCTCWRGSPSGCAPRRWWSVSGSGCCRSDGSRRV